MVQTANDSAQNDATTSSIGGKKGIASVLDWSVTDVENWARGSRCSNSIMCFLRKEAIDGQVLLSLSEDDIRDFRYRLREYGLTFGEVKKLWLAVLALQRQYAPSVAHLGVAHHPHSPNGSPLHRAIDPAGAGGGGGGAFYGENCVPSERGDCENLTPPMSEDGCATNIPPEFFKTGISVGYSFLVTWITSFVMVIVHERVPDMKRYPPLPDIFLDNVPHIPWAFHMCELTGTLLFFVWCCVCVFHKYRMVLLRRFFALAGTVFLLRCVTMLITSLSVPGTHLQCNQNDYAINDTELSVLQAIELRISRAYTIWSGLGMSIQGVRTCGDYMFSGHTVALTLLNFFITEYTPRNLYFLHTLTWLLNMFGIFFILAAHEHYSIDVFVAFYITSRLFLYYHTLANNQALMSHDSMRTRIWFPMFSYFESSVDGIIPNEYDTVGELLTKLFQFVLSVKDTFMLTARRYWLDPPHLAINSKSLLFMPATFKQHNVATSTHASVSNTPTPQSYTTLGRAEQERKKHKSDSLLSRESHDRQLFTEEKSTSRKEEEEEAANSLPALPNSSLNFSLHKASPLALQKEKEVSLLTKLASSTTEKKNL